MAEVKIYGGKRTVSVAENLVNVYNVMRPLDAREIESLLGVAGIEEDEARDMTNEELNEEANCVIDTEIRGILMLYDPEVQAQMKNLYEKRKKEMRHE